MSTPLKRADAHVGGFVLHDNGSIFWGSPEYTQEDEDGNKTVVSPAGPKIHHVSWIGDDGVRAVAANLQVLVTPEEIEQLAGLAAKFDNKEIA